jgi:hypothetical protein
MIFVPAVQQFWCDRRHTRETCAVVVEGYEAAMVKPETAQKDAPKAVFVCMHIK